MYDVLCMVDMCNDAVKCGQGVPEWLSHVMVKFIVNQCPLQSWQLNFGNHNAMPQFI